MTVQRTSGGEQLVTTTDFEGKVAVVTGAASGIGEAVARALGEAGVRVAALDRDEPALRSAVAKLTVEGVDVTGFPVDVRDEIAVEATVAAIVEQMSGIDYLVNVAGILLPATTRNATLADWSDTFAVNATGVFLLSRAVVDHMADRSGGAIVTVASNAAAVPRIGMAAYAASKAAAVMLTKCLALEVAHLGIRCNVVSPGSTDTGMLRTLWGTTDRVDATIIGSHDDYRVGIPLGKLARPADIAAAVAFLLSEAAGHVTMHEITVDGGAGLGA